MSQKQDPKAKKAKKDPQKDDIALDPNETYGLEEIIPSIRYSSLPEAKKLAYLYMIADGSFSLETLEEIAIEMDVIGEKMEADQLRLQAEILQMEKQLAEMDGQLDELAVKSCAEYREDIDTFLQYTADHLEAGKAEQEAEEIKKIQKKLTQE